MSKPAFQIIADAPPGGALLLARDAEHKAVGCVGLRPRDAFGCCEVKRLYVSSEVRGGGPCRALVAAVVAVLG